MYKKYMCMYMHVHVHVRVVDTLACVDGVRLVTPCTHTHSIGMPGMHPTDQSGHGYTAAVATTLH